MKCESWYVASSRAACLAALLIIGLGAVSAAEQSADEARLIEVLKSDAGWPEKQEVCRALRQQGTAQAVPALAALLGDERLSHMARYALEPMPYPDAGKALRDALPGLEGLPKAGVIISLGARRDAQAASLIAPLLDDANSDIARAAAGALGRIATREAVNALQEALKGVETSGRRGGAVGRPATTATQPQTRAAIAEGLLAAGEYLAQGGEERAAASIYAKLIESDEAEEYVRMGAFRGLVAAQPGKASRRLLGALGGEDPAFRGLAAQLVAETSDGRSTRRYATALSKLAPAGQVALLRGLADRGDSGARAAVVKAIDHSDPGVRIAAVKALSALGGAEDVPRLIALLGAEEEALAQAAAVSLTLMKDAAADNAIAAAVPGTEPILRVQLLALLAARRAAQAVPLAIDALADSDAAVRIGALDVLADNGGTDQAPAVVAAFLNAPEAGEQSAAQKALNRICSRYGDAVLPVVLDAMHGAGAEARANLLGTVALVRGPKAFETVLAALDDADAQVSGKALNLLSNWPTLDAAPHLLALAKSEDSSRYVLGLRGFVRLAQTEPDLSKRTVMLSDATKLAKRPDEQKLLLAAWGNTPTLKALDTLRPFLEQPAVRNEAALAIVNVAGELAGQSDEGKGRAKPALRAVLRRCENAAIRENAQALLAGLD